LQIKKYSVSIIIERKNLFTLRFSWNRPLSGNRVYQKRLRMINAISFRFTALRTAYILLNIYTYTHTHTHTYIL